MVQELPQGIQVEAGANLARSQRRLVAAKGASRHQLGGHVRSHVGLADQSHVEGAPIRRVAVVKAERAAITVGKNVLFGLDGAVAGGRCGFALAWAVHINEGGVGVNSRCNRFLVTSAAKLACRLGVIVDLFAEVEGGIIVDIGRVGLEETVRVVERGQVVPLVIVPVLAGHRGAFETLNFCTHSNRLIRNNFQTSRSKITPAKNHNLRNLAAAKDARERNSYRVRE